MRRIESRRDGRVGGFLGGCESGAVGAFGDGRPSPELGIRTLMRPLADVIRSAAKRHKD